MTAPSRLSGFPTTVTIDGVNMHTYGLIVDIRSIPMPSARSATSEIPWRHGDFDFTRFYASRTITLRGTIIADNHTQLMSNIDSIKSFFRLRENGNPFQLIFADQSDRYWSCRFQDGGDLQFPGLWYSGKTCQFSIVLKCIKPYSESTTITTVEKVIRAYEIDDVTYAGSFPAPLSMSIMPDIRTNALEVIADASESSAAWTVSGGTKCDETTTKLYGAKSIKIVTTSNTMTADIDISTIDKTKNYICILSFKRDTIYSTCTLEIVTDGTVVATSSISGSQGQQSVKVQASSLTGKTTILFRLKGAGAGTGFTWYIDGCAIYEISSVEYADASFTAPLYITDMGGDNKLDGINPQVSVYNSANIMQYGHGDSVNGWIFTTDQGWGDQAVTPCPVQDPYSDDKCLYGQSAYVTALSTFKMVSGYIDVCPSMTAYIKMQLLPRSIDAGNVIYVHVLEYDEDGWGGASYDTLIGTINASAATWQSLSYSLGLQTGTRRIRIKITGYGRCQFFVKKIIVSKTDVSYSKFSSKSILYTGTLAENDNLFIDSERFIATMYDYSAKSQGSAMAGISGDSIMIIPGVNHLKVIDARYSAAAYAKGAASCGLYKAIYSYRARYL